MFVVMCACVTVCEKSTTHESVIEKERYRVGVSCRQFIILLLCIYNERKLATLSE